MKYIALLRGINISGKNKISMPELKNSWKKITIKMYLPISIVVTLSLNVI